MDSFYRNSNAVESRILPAFLDRHGKCLPDELRAVLHSLQLLRQRSRSAERYHPAVTLGMPGTWARSASFAFLVFHLLLLWKTKIIIYLKSVIRKSKITVIHPGSQALCPRRDRKGRPTAFLYPGPNRTYYPSISFGRMSRITALQNNLIAICAQASASERA